MPIQLTFDATGVERRDYSDEIILSNHPVMLSASILVTTTVAEPYWEVYLPLVLKNNELVICKVIAAPGNILRRCIGRFSVHCAAIGTHSRRRVR